MNEENEKKSEMLLGTEKISKLLLRFSIPCIMSLLVSALYNIVDQIFIGQGVGYLGNAATNVVFPITVIGLGFALLIGDGAAAKLSLCLGKGDKESGPKTIANSIILMLIISFLIMLFGYIFTDNLLYLFGATDNCIGYARDYYRIILAGMPFYMLSSGLASVIRADGSPRYSMILMVVGAIINIICDPIAIFVFNWGVVGVAYATILGQLVSFVLAIIYFWHTKTFKFNKDCFKPHLSLLGSSLLLGISSFITQISIVLVAITTNNMIGKYGANSEYGVDIPLSVIGIVMKVFSIVVSIIVGISVGGQPIIGYNYGAKKYKRVLGTYKKVIISCGIVGLVATIIFEAFPQAIISIFGSESETYNKFATLCFRFYLSGICLTCLQKSSCIFLQAVGKPVKSILLSLSRDTLFLIPAVTILPIFYGIDGVMYSAPVADVLAIIVTSILIFIEYKKIHSLIKKEEPAIVGTPKTENN
ncbi:MAG: MATE family efflux transporter [Bacilli bacterium]